MEINKIYNENCLDTMARMEDNFIDLTVTSPPYDNLRNYNGYCFDFESVAKELYRVTKQGGVVVWVVGDSTLKGSETGTSFKQALFFKKCGFNLHDTMIYQKNAMPFPEQTRYIQCFEYMFIFSKGKPKTANMIQEPTRAKSGKPTQRNKDGSRTPLKYAKDKATRNKWNVWKYEVGYNKHTTDKFAYEHPAMFPEKLASDHIISWSNEGDTVLDCFMGANTTGKMAKQLNRDFIGIELDQEYFKIAQQRVDT